MHWLRPTRFKIILFGFSCIWFGSLLVNSFIIHFKSDFDAVKRKVSLVNKLIKTTFALGTLVIIAFFCLIWSFLVQSLNPIINITLTLMLTPTHLQLVCIGLCLYTNISELLVHLFYRLCFFLRSWLHFCMSLGGFVCLFLTLFC